MLGCWHKNAAVQLIWVLVSSSFYQCHNRNFVRNKSMSKFIHFLNWYIENLISDTSNKCLLKIRWTPHLISSVWDELFVQATISMCACHVMSPISQSSPCFPYSEYSIRPMLIDFPIWVLYVVMLLYRTIHSSIFKNAAFCLATCPHIDCWSNFQFKI